MQTRNEEDINIWAEKLIDSNWNFIDIELLLQLIKKSINSLGELGDLIKPSDSN